ncbi:hypothetical protein Golax_021735, partial [Gossypium laxum]|nr:hypothetical protein [Gossypium laxum]
MMDIENVRVAKLVVFQLGEEYSNYKLAKMKIRSLPKRYFIKATTIEETKDLERLAIVELICNIPVLVNSSGCYNFMMDVESGVQAAVCGC